MNSNPLEDININRWGPKQYVYLTKDEKLVNYKEWIDQKYLCSTFELLELWCILNKRRYDMKEQFPFKIPIIEDILDLSFDKLIYLTKDEDKARDLWWGKIVVAKKEYKTKLKDPLTRYDNEFI